MAVISYVFFSHSVAENEAIIERIKTKIILETTAAITCSLLTVVFVGLSRKPREEGMKFGEDMIDIIFIVLLVPATILICVTVMFPHTKSEAEEMSKLFILFVNEASHLPERLGK